MITALDPLSSSFLPLVIVVVVIAVILRLRPTDRLLPFFKMPYSYSPFFSSYFFFSFLLLTDLSILYVCIYIYIW